MLLLLVTLCKTAHSTNKDSPCPWPALVPPSPTGYCNCSKASGLVCTASVAGDTAPPPLLPLGHPPGPGLRVLQSLNSSVFAGSKVQHMLYLPPTWTSPHPNQEATRLMPMVVEFSGNGILPQDGANWTVNGWGLTAGQGFIWLQLPFVSALRGNGTCNQRNWFGCDPAACDLYSSNSNRICSENKTADSHYNPEPTVRYALLAVRMVLERYGGDPSRVLLTGHSRGALAVNFIGLHNDEIASLWAAFAPTSHYDGVKRWAYPESDNISALARLRRVGQRPVFIVAECDLATRYAKHYLRGTGVNLSNFHIEGTGFADHNPFWSLRESPTGARAAMRAWVRRVMVGGVAHAQSTDA